MIKKITAINAGNIGKLEYDFTGPCDIYDTIKGVNMVASFVLYDKLRENGNTNYAALAPFYLLYILADNADKLELFCTDFMEKDEKISIKVNYFTTSEEDDLEEHEYSLELTDKGIQKEVIDEFLFDSSEYVNSPFTSKLDILSKYTFKEIIRMDMINANNIDDYEQYVDNVKIAAGNTSFKDFIISGLFKYFDDLGSIVDFKMSTLNNYPSIVLVYDDGASEEISLAEEQCIRLITIINVGLNLAYVVIKKFSTLIIADVNFDFINLADLESILVAIDQLRVISPVQVFLEVVDSDINPIAGFTGTILKDFRGNFFTRQLI